VSDDVVVSRIRLPAASRELEKSKSNGDSTIMPQTSLSRGTCLFLGPLMVAFFGPADGAAELSRRMILMSDQDRAASVNPPAVMYNPMLPLPGLSPVGGKKVVGDLDCGLLSSDGRIFGSARLVAVSRSEISMAPAVGRAAA
jgi:hypothetical protein